MSNTDTPNIPYSRRFTVDVPCSKKTAKAMLDLLDQHFAEHSAYYWGQITEHYQRYKKLPESICSPELIGEDKFSDNYNWRETENEFDKIADGRYSDFGCYDIYAEGPRVCVKPDRYHQFAPDQMSRDMLATWMKKD